MLSITGEPMKTFILTSILIAEVCGSDGCQRFTQQVDNCIFSGVFGQQLVAENLARLREGDKVKITCVPS
jgi:hypothetical protein